MAIPTLSSVAPAIVWTGGHMVTLIGTGFRPGTVPSTPTNGPYPPPKPTMQVTAGGVVAKNVRVLSTTQLTCQLGAHDAGVVTLTVQNLDDDGVAIPGETASLAGALTYARPDLAARGDFDRLNRALMRLLKQQVIKNVTEWVSTDSGDEGFEVATLGDLPAIAIAGPQVDWATAAFQGNARLQVGGYPGTSFETRRRPIKVDVVYELSVITNNQQHVLALTPLIMQFFDRNRSIEILRDPADPSQGTIEYDMFIPFSESVRPTTGGNTSNLRSFVCACRIRGFGIEGIAGFENESMVQTGGVIADFDVGAVAKT
jgi:hypothetical protein